MTGIPPGLTALVFSGNHVSDPQTILYFMVSKVGNPDAARISLKLFDLLYSPGETWTTGFVMTPIVVNVEVADEYESAVAEYEDGIDLKTDIEAPYLSSILLADSAFISQSILAP